MTELENMIGHLQVQNQQQQALMMQSREIEKALEHIESSEDDIYRTVGPILVKTPKADIKGKLDEEKEEIEIKIKTIEGQEKKLKEKVKDNQEKIQGMMPAGQGGESTKRKFW